MSRECSQMRSSPEGSLIFPDLIRQLVLVPGPSRKMPRQQFPRFRDAVHDSLSESFLLEVPGHLVRHFLPKTVAAFRMHAGVADDGKLPHPRRDENQNSVALLRFFHFQVSELMLGRRDRVLRFPPRDEYADFA